MIKPIVSHFVVIEPCVAHTSFADDRVFGRTGVTAMKNRSDNQILLIREFGVGGFADVIISCDVRTDRNVIPGRKPESRNIDFHIVVPESAFIPRRIVRCSFNHRTGGRNRHFISKNPVRSVNRFDNVHCWKMPESF